MRRLHERASRSSEERDRALVMTCTPATVAAEPRRKASNIGPSSLTSRFKSCRHRSCPAFSVTAGRPSQVPYERNQEARACRREQQEWD